MPEFISFLGSSLFGVGKSRGFEGGEVEVEAGGFEVGDGSEEGEVTEASGDAFSELQFAVDGLDGCTGYPAFEEPEDSFPVAFEGAGKFAEWFQSASRSPSTPPFERGFVAGGQHVLQAFAQPEGAAQFGGKGVMGERGSGDKKEMDCHINCHSLFDSDASRYSSPSPTASSRR